METEPEEEQERGVKEKVKDFVLEKLQRLRAFLALFPMLLSSAVFNVGTIALAISVLGWHSLWFIFGSLLLHLFLFFSIPLPAGLDIKVMKTFNLENHLPEEETDQSSKPLLNSLFFCSSNLFIFSCSTGKAKKHRVTFLLLVQFLRFLINTCLLMLLLLFYGFNANFQRVGTCICVFVNFNIFLKKLSNQVGLTAAVLEVFGLVLLSLVCNSSVVWIKMFVTKK